MLYNALIIEISDIYYYMVKSWLMILRIIAWYIMINYVKDFFVLYAVPGTYSIPSPSPATDSPEPVILRRRSTR